jgi:hypothetical protein
VFFSRKPIFLRHAIPIRRSHVIIPFMFQAKRIDVYAFFLTAGRFSAVYLQKFYKRTFFLHHLYSHKYTLI